VQDALNRFDTALAAHDVQQLLAAGIEPASVKGWQRFFKDNPRATVTDSCSGSDLSISGDTANWSCKETSTIVSDGRPVQYAHNIRFTFTRKNGEWTIADRR
jgi:ketosteroid isomerase-like protein